VFYSSVHPHHSQKRAKFVMSDVLSRDTVARCYGNALFDVMSASESFADDVRDFVYLADLVSIAEMKAFWSSPWESLERKQRFLREVVLSEVVGYFSEAICNALEVMLAEQRMDIVLGAAKVLQDLARSHLQELKGVVVFAEPQPQEFVMAVKKGAQLIFGDFLELVERVDPELIAGFEVRVGNLRYDASLANHVAHLKSYLAAQQEY